MSFHLKLFEIFILPNKVYILIIFHPSVAITLPFERIDIKANILHTCAWRPTFSYSPHTTVTPDILYFLIV